MRAITMCSNLGNAYEVVPFAKSYRDVVTPGPPVHFVRRFADPSDFFSRASVRSCLKWSTTGCRVACVDDIYLVFLYYNTIIIKFNILVINWSLLLLQILVRLKIKQASFLNSSREKNDLKFQTITEI